jgi:hypothetical protein
MKVERKRTALLVGVVLLVAWANGLQAGVIYIPNASFETPSAPNELPYAIPAVADWQKAPVPSWWLDLGYSAESWDQSVGTFHKVPFAPIDNIDGNQAAFFFSTPGVELFQDLEARFEAGQSYRLTVGLVGGGLGMPLGIPIEIRLYYRDDAGNRIPVGATTALNNNASSHLSHLTDYELDIPEVAAGDSWAGRNIGVQLISTVTLDQAGGYWDVDNFRLTSVPEPASLAILTLGAVALRVRRR